MLPDEVLLCLHTVKFMRTLVSQETECLARVRPGLVKGAQGVSSFTLQPAIW